MIKKISHIILSALMLIATVGVTVSKHYCGTDMVVLHFVDDSCDMEMDDMPVKSLHDNCNDDMNCCHTEVESHQFLTDYVQTDELELASNFQAQTTAVNCVNNMVNISSCYTSTGFAMNYPPPVKAPSQSVLQTFRC